MELLNTTSDNSFSTNLTIEENESARFSENSASHYSEAQEKYYKESIMMNYQRYKALFRSKLVLNILIDDKNIIRDLNKKAKEEFNGIFGQELKIGASLSAWFAIPDYGPLLKEAILCGLNQIVEFAYTDTDGVKHHYHLEVILFISPEDSRLLKCISAIRVR